MVISKNLIWIWNFHLRISQNFWLDLNICSKKRQFINFRIALVLNTQHLSTSDPIVSYSRFWLDGNCVIVEKISSLPPSFAASSSSSFFSLNAHSMLIQLMLLILIFMLIKLSTEIKMRLNTSGWINFIYLLTSTW